MPQVVMTFDASSAALLAGAWVFWLVTFVGQLWINRAKDRRVEWTDLRSGEQRTMCRRGPTDE